MLRGTDKKEDTGRSMRIRMVKKKLILIYGLSCLLFSILISVSGCGIRSDEGAGRREEAEIQTGYSGEQREDDSEMMRQELSDRNPESSEQVSADQLFAAKNPYLGNAPADGILLDMVKRYYGITEACTMKPQTSALPCGLTLHFEKEPDNISMQKAAAVLLAMIENCCYVSWDYPLDEAGNRDWICFSVHDLATAADIGLYALSEEYAASAKGLEKMLALLESIKAPCPARKRAADIEEAVSEAILEYNRNVYGEAEVSGEGHLILDIREAEERENYEASEGRTSEGRAVTITAYVQTMYGVYGFENGNFVKNGGTGVLPAVIQLSKEPDGSCVIKHFQRPADGGDFIDSIHELFPEPLWEQCVSPSEEVRDALKGQERAYAAEYLKSIGREDAAIGDYGDFPYTLLTDAGVSVEISNKLLETTKHESNTPAAYAPHGPGNTERLEEGIRYIYETTCDPETKEIVYSKLRYDTGELVARQIFDTETGELIKSEP